MNCTTVKKNLSEWFDGRLPPAIGAAFESHAASCPACATETELYRRLFTAIRSIPSATTDSPAPLPSSVESFGQRPRVLSPFAKATAVAAVILLCLFVGKFGYEVGRVSSSDDGASNAGMPMAADAMAIAWPSKPAGERLRRSVDSTNNLAWILDAAQCIPDPKRALDTVSRVLRLSPLGDDARILGQLDKASLGVYTQATHAFSSEVTRVYSGLSHEMSSTRDESVALARCRELMFGSDIREYLKAIEPMVARFDPMPFDDAHAYGVELGTSFYPEDRPFQRGFVLKMTGLEGPAMLAFEQYLRSEPRSPWRGAAAFILKDAGRNGDLVRDLEVEVQPFTELQWISSRFRFNHGAFELRITTGPRVLQAPVGELPDTALPRGRKF